MLSTKLKEAAGNIADATLYVDDVFSTYLYTGNGSTQTITNGIDLAGKGGMVWMKKRNAAESHWLIDTARGSNYALFSDSTSGQDLGYSPYFSFGSSGFNLTGSLVANTNAATYASWTFREAAKFFDVQTVTHTNGTANNIDLSVLGTVGMVIAKITTTLGDWTVWQRSLTASNNLKLNTTAAQSTTNAWLSVSGTTATLAAAAPTGTYVIYAYAHDTSSTGIIQCGSFVSNIANGTFPTVNLGWEPQWILWKSATTASAWFMADTTRGWDVNGNSQQLSPNSSNPESADTAFARPTATGFTGGSGDYGATYIYMAIRRPNKPPTTGTQVFSPNLSAATTGTPITTGFPFDLQIQEYTGFPDGNFVDRLRGVSSTSTVSGPYIRSTTTAAEISPGSTTLNVNNTGFQICGGFAGASTVYWNFKRAPGFFDVVCYTSSSGSPEAHNLGVVPELIISKVRNLNGQNWFVNSPPLMTTYGKLNLADAWAGDATPYSATATTFNPISYGSTKNMVSYLFATLAGIQYINSYVGDGTTGRVINCGFSAGARFICIKATSTTGSWWLWDSARGITAGNDPALQLNSTAAEITSADAIDPSSSGFIVNQEATCSINASGVSYLVWAIA